MTPFFKIDVQYPTLSISSILQQLSLLASSEEFATEVDHFEGLPEQLETDNFPYQRFEEFIFAKLPANFLTADFRPLMQTATRFLYDNTLTPFLQMEETDRVFKLHQVLKAGLVNLEKLVTDSRHYCIELTIKKLLANGAFTQLLMDSGVSNYLEFKLTNQTQIRQDDELKKVVSPWPR